MVTTETHLIAVVLLAAMVTLVVTVPVFIEETARVGKSLVQLSFRHGKNNTKQEIKDCKITGLHQNVFSCEKSGILFLRQKLNYDVKNSYNITVSYGVVNTDTRFNANFLINIKKAPEPVLKILPINIDEELPVGTIIGKPFSIGYPDDSQNFIYSLKGKDSKYLDVNHSTGHLSILERIDRDVANDSIALNVVIVVTVADKNMYSAALNITVIDINDHAPQFSSETINLAVNENQQGALHKFVVDDRDLGDNAKVKLSILEENLTFTIRGTTLFANAPLDFETKIEYELIIMAMDSPKNDTQKTGRTTVIINIKPVNEFSPVWEEPMKGESGSRATVQLPNVDKGETVVTRLLASDKDAGADGYVTYSIAEVLTDLMNKADDVFTVVSNKLLLTSPTMSHGTVRFYDVVVNASDGGKPSKSVLGVIRVNVQPKSTNLHDPVWMSPPLNDDMRAVINIDRDTKPSTTIVTIHALDVDSGYGGKIQYTIFKITADNGVTTQYTFFLDPSNGRLRLLHSLVGSTVNYYDLDVVVFDLGIPRRSIARTIRVNIKSEDHFAWLSPMVGFNGSNTTLSLLKTTKPWTVVTTLNATDSTSETGNIVTYRLVSCKTDQGIVTSSPIFLVQPEGEIRTVKPLLLDTVLFYDIEVEALGVFSRTPKNILGTIRIMLVSDVKKPKLTWTSLMSVNVSEAMTPGTTITTLLATHSDHTDDQPITYSLLSSKSDKGEDVSDMFSLEQATANIILNSGLDRELLSGPSPYYSLQVEAVVDHQLKPATKITGTLKLFIMDENEFSPTFDKSFYKKLVTCDIGIGYNVLEFSLKDKDATASFELRLEHPSEFVDASTQIDVGALVLKHRPAAPSKGGTPMQNFLNLILSDGGSPEKLTKTYVLLMIPWCSEIITIPATTAADVDPSVAVTNPGVTFDEKSTAKESSSESSEMTSSLPPIITKKTSVSRPNFSSMMSSTPTIIRQQVVDETGAWIVRVLCIILFLGYVFLVGLFITKRLNKSFGRVEPQPNQTENNHPTEYSSARDTSSQNVVQQNYQDEPSSDPMLLPPYSGNVNFMDHIGHSPMTPVPSLMPAAPLVLPTMATTGHPLPGNLTTLPSLLTEPVQATPPLCTASQAPPKYLPPINPDQSPKPVET